MAAQNTPNRVPYFSQIETPHSAEWLAEFLTRTGPYDLIPSEVFWRERYRYLKEAGYVLRPRYKPNWKPSWADTELSPNHFEDSVMLMKRQMIDAKREADNKRIAIKRVEVDTEELGIMNFLSTCSDKTNHAVPLLAVLPDPFDRRLSLMVMPFLRPFDNPRFATIGEVVEFIDQMIEGLVFLHKHRIAHRDIATANIMMDGTPLYPDGHHPVRLQYSEDLSHVVTPLSRTDHPVRYFYIDFGLSIKFPEGAPPYAVGDVGRDAEVPELSLDVPYDTFKVDIFALGNLLRKQFEQRYNSMEFLLRLIDPMTRRQPETRPTADQVLAEWQSTRSELSEPLFRWRLGPKSEPAIGRMFNDTVAVAREGVYRLRKFIGT